MPEPAPLVQRLKDGVLRLDQNPPIGGDENALPPLRRSLERTIVRQNPGTTAIASPFRFQLTGGKPLLFLGNEALPLEPARLAQLLNTIGVQLQSGESLELDGELAAWLIRPEVNVTDTNLRAAEITLRGLKSGRDRDHSAAQVAESAKVRLRGRLTQLVSALQAAQRDSEEAAKRPPPPPPASVPSPPISAPISPIAGYHPPIMDTPTTPEVLAKAIRKVLAAIEGCGFKAATIGDSGHQAWGAKKPAEKVTLLISSGEAQRESLLGAARGEGLQQAPGGGPLNLRYNDSKSGASALVDLVEATTPFLKNVITRAQPGAIFNAQVRVATCEDLILLRAGSSAPGDRDSVIELLRGTAGRIDGAYLKKEAEAAGVFDQLKSAWQQAKAQG
jgi:hypothetical protein